MRKLLTALICAFMFTGLASNAFSATDEEALLNEDENTQKAPQKKKKPGTKEVEANASVKAEPPVNTQALSEEQLQMLSSIISATQMENAQTSLMDAQLRNLELKQKIQAIVNQPTPEEQRLMQEATMQIKEKAITFPMPGGNPQVIAILGGNKKALEATLLFPDGTKYDVTKNMMIDNGYKVQKVMSNGIILEKNGFTMNIPVSRGESKRGMPEGAVGEMGTPVESPEQGPAPVEMTPEGIPSDIPPGMMRPGAM